ncbi:hypothetical protein [Mucilaginibacter sp. SP1R1]|uniref:hypothetical protein n=1 Tax=Mucilaginibacter sp. SP1R1 TaxID=2723091 RepID=UPI0016137C00|nr:hypothetical protein [Mucilaginibacter sp. SP1R1]MBB6148331.1 hypothetical protein [Mucilaginibacter sp. SP1R1]
MSKLKHLLLITLFLQLIPDTYSSPAYPKRILATLTDSIDANKEVKQFNKKADAIIIIMETAAKSMSAEGVCMIAFIPTTTPERWISQMKVVGKMKTKDANLLGIVYTKASEMADTYKDSGSGVRPLLSGECGYKGGLIKPYKSGYIIAAFSGGSNAQDLAISKIGLSELEKGF